MKEKMNKLGLVTIKNFCSVKDTVKKMKRQVTSSRKYMQNTYLTKDTNYTKNYLTSAKYCLRTPVGSILSGAVNNRHSSETLKEVILGFMFFNERDINQSQIPGRLSLLVTSG